MKRKNGFFDIDEADSAEISENNETVYEPILESIGCEEKKITPKRQIAIILLFSVILVAVFLIVRNVYYSESPDSIFYPEDWLKPSISNKKPNYKYYDPDWESDILNDSKYLELKGDIIYAANDSVSVSVGKNDYLNVGGKGLQFMADYVEAVIAGDHEALNKMFTSDYFKDNEPYEDFPQQRLYNIKIKKYHYADPEYLDTDVKDEYYIITYKIDRNDGMFRDDIGQEGELAQLFELLIYDGGTVKIDNIISLPGYLN